MIQSVPKNHAKKPQYPKVLPKISIFPKKNHGDFCWKPFRLPCWRSCLLFNSLRCHCIAICCDSESVWVKVKHSIPASGLEVSAVLESIQQSIQVQLWKNRGILGQWSHEGNKATKVSPNVGSNCVLIKATSHFLIWFQSCRQCGAFGCTRSLICRYLRDYGSKIFTVWIERIMARPFWLQTSAIRPNFETRQVNQATLHATLRYWFRNQIELWPWSIDPRSIQILFGDARNMWAI